MLKKNERKLVLHIQYAVVLCAVSMLTLVLFVLFFMNGENSVFAKMIQENKDKKEKQIDNTVLNAPLDVPAEEKQQLALQLATYDRYLSSGYLTVVNHEKPLSEDFQAPALSALSPNPALQMESGAADQLELLLADLSAAGYTYSLNAAYRTTDAQKEAYNAAVQENMNAGYTVETAEQRAAESVPPAGENEYETGLLVEISGGRRMGSSEFSETPLYEYLLENACKYGFILRYPQDKSHITGVAFNACIFRYVGDVECSTYIKTHKLSLEEYLDYVNREKQVVAQRLLSLEQDQSS